MLRVLVCGVALTTLARICRVWGVAVFTVPTVHTPVPLSYVPWLGVADTNVKPAGSRSLSSTLVAAFGPSSRTVPVNVIVSPTFGCASLTVCVIVRSARWGVIVALAVLFAGFGSN